MGSSFDVAERLQKYLARAGVASRRAAEELIRQGTVSVNGRTVRQLGTSVEESDRVEVNGKIVRPHTQRTYLLMHKPVNVVTTMRDPQGRMTVAQLIPKDAPRVVPVGRLDYDTSGALLLTNDGELANRLAHPRFGVEKTYRATVMGRLSKDDVSKLMAGIRLTGFRARSARVRVLKAADDRSVIDISIHEGKNRQVRKMLEALGHPVVALARLRFGALKLGALPPGRTRPLTSRELAQLQYAGRVPPT